MSRLSFFTAAAALAIVAGSASAATIALGGGVLTGSFGSGGVLAVNSSDSVPFSASASNTSVSGDVIINNTGGNNLLLTLTNLVFTSSRSSAITLTITITQDYAITNNTGWTGSHQFNGDVDFSQAGQSASVTSASTHESTMLPTLTQTVNSTGPGNMLLNQGQGAATNITPVATPFRIFTIYTIVLNRGTAGSVTLNLPNSGVDQASRAAGIPLPSAGLAGLAGMAGLVSVRRRRSI